MAKKEHPKFFRKGVLGRTVANWYAPDSEVSKLLHQDLKIRSIINEMSKPSGVDSIVISRNANEVSVDLYVARPGIAIGKGGTGIEAMTKKIKEKLGVDVRISVHEVKHPYLSAALVAQSIEDAVLRNVPPKVAIKRELEKIEASGAKGARIEFAGIGPIKQARTERVEMRGGRMPLTTIRADVDYAYLPILTNNRKYGVKVYIYRQSL